MLFNVYMYLWGVELNPKKEKETLFEWFFWKGTLTFTGQDESFLAFDVQAQPGEFPHMCVIFREVQARVATKILQRF